MSNPIKAPVEGYEGVSRPGEIWLAAGAPKDASYIFRRILFSESPLRILADYRGETANKTANEFGKLVDLINANPWTKAAVLKVEQGEYSVIFSTGTVIILKSG